MAYNLGNEVTGIDTFPGQGDRCMMTPFTSAGAGTMSRAWAWFPATAGSANFKLVVYNSNGSVPTTLLEVSAPANVSGGGWIDFGAMSASIAESTEYYIGLVASSYESFAERYEYPSSFGTVRCEGLTYASPGDNPTVSQTYPNIKMIAYVEVATGGLFGIRQYSNGTFESVGFVEVAAGPALRMAANLQVHAYSFVEEAGRTTHQINTNGVYKCAQIVETP